jgi:two-component system, OmpR family, response regulator MprA
MRLVLDAMQPHGQRVLVVEDDPSIARLLEIELGEAGYRVELAGTGAEGLAAVEREEPDLVVLDVRLPDLDGLSVCRSVRRSGHRVPILMLTALDRVGDRVLGLDAGADDYLAKPFAIEELLARLRALARRTQDADEWLEVGEVRLDAAAREVTVRGRPVELSAREFDLLAFLMHAPGRVFTREQIYEGVWGYTYPGRTKVIDFFISALRRKLDTTPEDSVIRTVRGVGYTIRP